MLKRLGKVTFGRDECLTCSLLTEITGLGAGLSQL